MTCPMDRRLRVASFSGSISLVSAKPARPIDHRFKPTTLVGYRFFEGCYVANAINVALTARYRLTGLQIVAGGPHRRWGYRLDAGISAVDLTRPTEIRSKEMSRRGRPPGHSFTRCQL